MAHGVVFATEIQQTGSRGADKLASINWFMVDAEHSLGGGTFSVRTMLSMEPATITDRRYPELFQTGETAYGRPIVNGEHPARSGEWSPRMEYSHPLEKSELGALRCWWDPALGTEGIDRVQLRFHRLRSPTIWRIPRIFRMTW